jgi:hypothetical protein
MTNEEIIEEILYEAHILGIYSEVIELVKNSKEKEVVDRFQKSLQQLKSKIEVK